MPARVRPANFVGNKNSGRKRVYEEHNKASAINKLWEKVNKKVQSGEELDDFEKELVKSLLPKTIKQDVALSGTLTMKSLLDQLDGDNKGTTEKQGVEAE